MAIPAAAMAVGRTAGRLLTGGSKNPYVATGSAALAVPFVGSLAAPVVREASGANHTDRMEEMKSLLTKDSPQRRVRRLAKLNEENRARLMAMHPEILTQMRAGQTLPPGSRYYGPDNPEGSRVLQELLTRMATDGL